MRAIGINWIAVMIVIGGTLPSQAADSLQVASLLAKADSDLFFARFNLAITNYRALQKKAESTFPDIYAAAINGETAAHISKLDFGAALTCIQQFQAGIPGATPEETGRARFLEGKCYAEMGEYEFAMRLLREAESMLGSGRGKSLERLADCFVWQGACYRRMGDFERAKLLGQKAVDTYRQYSDGEVPGLADALNNIGYAYFAERDWEKAMPYFEMSIEIRQELFGEWHPAVAESYENIASCLTEMGEFDQALALSHKSLEICLTTLPPGHRSISFAYNSIGSIHHMRKQYDKSHEMALKAKEVLVHNYGAYHPELITTYNNLATRHGISGEFEIAKTYIQQGLMSAAADFRNSDFATNPELASIVYHPHIFNLLFSKAMVAQRNFRTSKDPGDLEIALETFKLASQLIDRLRSGYELRSAREAITARAMQIYEGGISLSHQLYTQHQDPAYLDFAFECFEKSKSLSVMEAVRESKARKFGKVPEAIIQEIEAIQSAIGRNEKSLFWLQADSVSYGNKMAQLRDSILKGKTQLANKLAEIETRYPEYYRLKYDTQVIDLSAAQSSLAQQDQALLSYFWGARNVYAFAITSDTTILVRLAVRGLADQINALRGSIYQYFMEPDASDSLYQIAAAEFVQHAYGLYDQIVHPLVAGLGTGKSAWVVIPDGEIGYLPFECLLTDSVLNPTAFSTHPYLLRDRQISYAYSATLIHQIEEQSGHSKGMRMLSIAPEFEQNTAQFASVETFRRENLGPLHYNLQEVLNIASLIGGKTLQAEEASLENFLKLGPDYGIIHLATHGKADDRKGDFSFLAFSGASSNNQAGRLYVRDLYDMKLPAEMAVLSACETGIGKLSKGEGIESLARGFFYAGTRSLITTLWSVNDAKTADIMERFYRNLKEGASKDAALQAAKMDYVKEHDDFYSHPYFWSGYIAVGDMRPFPIEDSRFGMLGGGSLLCLLLGVLGYWIYRRKNRI